MYRNCFRHSEQFLYTTCFPHVLQKEELLTKIYLYYLRCSNSKPFLFQILNLHKPLTISSFMVTSQKLNSWIKSVICQKIRSKAWLSLVEWLPKSVSKLMKPWVITRTNGSLVKNSGRPLGSLMEWTGEEWDTLQMNFSHLWNWWISCLRDIIPMENWEKAQCIILSKIDKL